MYLKPQSVLYLVVSSISSKVTLSYRLERIAPGGISIRFTNNKDIEFLVVKSRGSRHCKECFIYPIKVVSGSFISSSQRLHSKVSRELSRLYIIVENQQQNGEI